MSQVACDVLAQKYFRKAGVPTKLKKVKEDDVPEWLWRGVPDEEAMADSAEEEKFAGESSAKQVFDRLAGTWTYWGWKGGYFDSEADAQIYFDEMRYTLARQMAAPNSPQWFNTGLHWAYGIDGPSQGHHYVDFTTGKLTRSDLLTSTRSPTPASFNRSTTISVTENGIMDLWVREARLFKWLRHRHEFLESPRRWRTTSGGGKSSGLMSFLKIGDRAAGADQIRVPTCRAAKMVVVDIDHPDVEKFIDWKVEEEQKVAALVSGSKMCEKHLNRIMSVCREGDSDDRFVPRNNPELRKAIIAAREAAVPENYIQRVIEFARQGHTEIEFKTYDTDWDSDAYLTVSGQNSNNSVRITNDFVKAVEADGPWALTMRTNGAIAEETSACELWDKIGYAAWACADPGLQFDTTINEWHTCGVSGRINASNPCSEYMFLDDTACNLASLNLMAFQRADGTVDVDAFEHAVRLWTVVLEISVLMAQFPSKEIAQLSYEFRTLGLGFANIGGLLMASGHSYIAMKGAICARSPRS